MEQVRPADIGGPVWAYRGLSIVTALLLILQPVLAGQFEYNDKPDYRDAHSVMANVIFLTVAGQFVLALLARRTLGIGLAVLNLVMIILVGMQIGFGYAAEDNPDRLALHLPLGVLLFGLGLTAAFLAFFDLRTQRRIT